MRESKVEAHLKKRVEALGGEVRKLRYVGRAHAPDRLVLLSWAAGQTAGHKHFSSQMSFGQPIDAWQHPLVECKRPGLDATAGQAREHERLRKAGFVVLVLDTIEKIDEVFG